MSLLILSSSSANTQVTCESKYLKIGKNYLSMSLDTKMYNVSERGSFANIANVHLYSYELCKKGVLRIVNESQELEIDFDKEERKKMWGKALNKN